MKNDEMQGAQIPRNEAYMEYVAMTRNEAQRRRSRFSTACYDSEDFMDNSFSFAYLEKV